MQIKSKQKEGIPCHECLCLEQINNNSVCVFEFFKFECVCVFKISMCKFKFFFSIGLTRNKNAYVVFCPNKTKLVILVIISLIHVQFRSNQPSSFGRKSKYEI